jgi:hypothetical protein
MQAMKEWYASHPHLFQKRPYDRPGCDSYWTGASDRVRPHRIRADTTHATAPGIAVTKLSTVIQEIDIRKFSPNGLEIAPLQSNDNSKLAKPILVKSRREFNQGFKAPATITASNAGIPLRKQPINNQKEKDEKKLSDPLKINSS